MTANINAVDEVVALQIPASPEFVALARLVVSAMAASDGALADEQVDDLKIAVSEACTNAIEAYGDDATEQPVVVRCWTGERGLEVSIEDRGPGFDPSELPDHPPVTDPDRLRFERGLGIPLIRALVDEVEITSDQEGTAVRMVMRHGEDAGAP